MKGKVVGSVIYYYKNGQVEMVKPYVDGVENGVAKYYTEEGKLEREENWVNGVKQ